MDEEIKESKTKILQELMKLRKTKNIMYKGIYRKYDRQIIG